MTSAPRISGHQRRFAKLAVNVRPVIALHFLHFPTGRIHIPAPLRSQSLFDFALSGRLSNLLQRENLSVLGDLHGLRVEDFLEFQNCGTLTARELERVVREALRSAPAAAATPEPGSLDAERLVAPEEAHPFLFADLPISVRLGHVLQALGITRLGELHGRAVSELLACKNCGVRTIAEVRELIARAAAGEFDAGSDDVARAPGQLLWLLEMEVAVLDPLDRELLLDRIGGGRRRPQTLAQIGKRQGVTRERVRQLQEALLHRLRKCRGPRIPRLLDLVEQRCVSAVCPLTPELLTSWVAEHPVELFLPAAAHVRLLGALREGIPSWPEGHDRVGGRDGQSRDFGGLLFRFVNEAAGCLPVADGYARLRATRAFAQIGIPEFFARLRRERRVDVVFRDIARPLLVTRWMSASQASMLILAESDLPLTAEEIHARAIARFGAALVHFKPGAMENVPAKNAAIHRMGGNLFGMEKHFQLPPGEWERVRAEIARLLAKCRAPLSATAIIEQRLIASLPKNTTPHEIAAILRVDRRFISLGALRFELRTARVAEARSKPRR